MEDKISVIDLSEDPDLIENCEECSIDTSDTCLKGDCLSTENGTSVDSEVEKQASPSHCRMDNSLVADYENSKMTSLSQKLLSKRKKKQKTTS